MISKLLDKLIPLQTEEERLEEVKAELAEAGYPVTNYKSGGIFYMLLRVWLRIEYELTALARRMLVNGYVSSADNVDWLDLRAGDYGKARKQAVKTQGNLTLTRSNTATAVKIAKGYLFKSSPAANGEELRYIATNDCTFSIGADTLLVPIEAELPGSTYNVPAGKITHSLIHLETVDTITNAEGWITREGADIEDIESLRRRTLGAFAELATHPTRNKYKSVCEAVEGVLYVQVDDQHPRGQGTIDIIVTSPIGGASEALLDEVLAAAQTIAGPYDNLLAKSSQTVEQDIAVTILLPSNLSEDGIAARAEQVIRELFVISSGRALNELYLSDIVVAVKGEIPTAKSVRVTEPAADLLLATDQVIVLGSVTITIERA